MANNISDKTNKAIAELANQIMTNSPAKVQDYKPVEPLNNEMVEKVLKSGMNTRFDKKSLKEGNLEGLVNNYALTMKAPVSAKKEPPPFEPDKNPKKRVTVGRNRPEGMSTARWLARQSMSKIKKEETEQENEVSKNKVNKFHKKLDTLVHSTFGKSSTEMKKEEAGPLKGHPYHQKSDAELRYIVKDAGEAAKAMRGHNDKAEAKYLDQVNDASTILHHRKKMNESSNSKASRLEMIKKAVKKVEKRNPYRDEEGEKEEVAKIKQKGSYK